MAFAYLGNMRLGTRASILCAALLIAGCQPVEMAEPAIQATVPQPTTAVAVPQVEESPTAIPETESPASTAEVSTPAADPEAADVSDCITCHTDREALVASMKAVEAIPSENTGEG